MDTLDQRGGREEAREGGLNEGRKEGRKGGGEGDLHNLGDGDWWNEFVAIPFSCL